MEEDKRQRNRPKGLIKYQQHDAWESKGFGTSQELEETSQAKVKDRFIWYKFNKEKRVVCVCLSIAFGVLSWVGST